MARKADNEVLDALLDKVREADELVVCAGEPADYNDAKVTRNLAEGTPSFGANGDYAGTGGGRSMTSQAIGPLSVTADGTADHVALLRSSNNTLLYVTVSAAQGLLNGNQVNVGAWDVIVGDPTAPP